MTAEKITRRQLADLLERNCYPSAAESIMAGNDPAKAVEYFDGKPAPYDDSEGRWIADVPAALRERRLIVTD